MRVTVFRITLMLAIALSFAAVSANAQSVVKRQRFIVPFDFNVGNKVLPAGEYSVSEETQVVAIRSRNGKHNILTIPTAKLFPTNRQTTSKLSFRNEGGQYYLAQVWLPDGVGRKLNRPRTFGPELAQNISLVEIPASVIQ